MNYTKHYNLLINRAKNRTLNGYVEKHHIIPRCLGGTDDTENIVSLLPEEHYIAHLLLVKMHPDNKKLLYAAMMMTVSSTTTNRNNKIYSWLRRRYANSCKLRVADKNPSYGKPWYHNPLTGESGKFNPAECPQGWNKGRVARKQRYCIKCNIEIQYARAKWCDKCRIKGNVKSTFKSEKCKAHYTTEDKINALNAHDGNIRQALYSLGLNDSGWHYRKMKAILETI